jgi:hypothetical protein
LTSNVDEKYSFDDIFLVSVAVMNELRKMKNMQSYFLQVVLLSRSDDAAIASLKIQIFSQYSDLFEAFSERVVNTLLEHAAHDLVIDTQEKNFLFDIIYNLFANELRILRVYIEKNLEKEFITLFTFFTAILILFIKKKDDELKLCVNYCEFNEITIKNRYSLFLIKEVINRLIEVKIYIKLDIRIVYNLIRVRARNE